MKRLAALLLLLTLSFPFFMQSGLILRFYQQSVEGRKEQCVQKYLFTCAGKCQLIKILKESTDHANQGTSLPILQTWVISPFIVSGFLFRIPKSQYIPTPQYANISIPLSAGVTASPFKPPMFL